MAIPLTSIGSVLRTGRSSSEVERQRVICFVIEKEVSPADSLVGGEGAKMFLHVYGFALKRGGGGGEIGHLVPN